MTYPGQRHEARLKLASGFQGKEMTVQDLVLGFAALVAGLFLSQVVKHRLGWAAICAACSLAGAFGLGYAWGHGDALEKAREVVSAAYQEPRPAEAGALFQRLGDLAIQMIDLRVDTWFGMVSVLLLIAGAIVGGALILSELEKKPRQPSP